jgi:hypothetical protein
MNGRLRYPLLATVGLIALAIGLLAYRQTVQPVGALWSQTLTIDATVTLATPTPSATSTLYPSCGAGCTRENTTPPASNTLVTTGASGTVTLNNPSGEKWVIFKSAAITSVSGRAGWTVTLNVTSTTGPAGSIALWYVNPFEGACGATPATSAATYIAGASFTFTAGTMSIPLTAGTNAGAVPANSALCLRVDRTGGGSATIATNGTSALDGPFTP